jgi:serine protease Do
MRSFVLVLALGMGLATPGAFGQQTPRPFGQALQAPAEGASYLGVGLREIDADRAKALRLPESVGVEITQIYENSPAAAAGLMPGDVVVEYNGQRVEGMEQFARLVRETPAGRETKLQIFRNGAAQTIAARIASRPAAAISPFAVQPPSPPEPPANLQQSLSTLRLFGSGTTMGAETQALNGQLAEYFGVKEGVLVRSVAKNSPAERAGIKAGDVITRVGDAKVASPSEISSQIRGRAGQNVAVTLTREHRETTVNVMLDSGRDNSRRY